MKKVECWIDWFLIDPSNPTLTSTSSFLHNSKWLSFSFILLRHSDSTRFIVILTFKHSIQFGRLAQIRTDRRICRSRFLLDVRLPCRTYPDLPCPMCGLGPDPPNSSTAWARPAPMQVRPGQARMDRVDRAGFATLLFNSYHSFFFFHG